MEKPVELVTPLGGDVLKFLRMIATEEIGRLFGFSLDLLSENTNVSAEDLLGKPMTVRLALKSEGTRYFHGMVTQFSQVEVSERTATYRVTLRPWLWFLTQTTDCKIFQGKTVPQIIKSVLSEHGFSDVEDRLTADYRTWEYCVQYRETDFNFISRLMEQEGIYYYFKHEDSRHVLVLADSISAHDSIAEYEKVRFLAEATTAVGADHIYSWTVVKRVQPGKYVLNDFDFKNPKATLLGEVSDPKSHTEADQEVFDHPGEYVTKSEGKSYAKIRLEELHTTYETFHGGSFARGLAAGALFTLTDHVVGSQNAEYLITAVTHDVQQEEFESGASSPELTYKGDVSAISSRQQFRSARLTPKPMVQGPQTAMVVGKAGEEIYTDEYGRVKVQFHWDRYGALDENSSCWVRVAQVWAGKNWGAIHIPRIGQEVIVDFLEGDPDRPIITGRVYNQDSMPPYGLPANMTQSGIKSRSTKGGGSDNFNEIRFEDLKGSEHMYIHAEKDQATVVEHDQSIEVGNDRAEKIGRDRGLDVGRDKMEAIHRDKSIKVDGNHSEDVTKNMAVSVGLNLSETVGVNYAETVGAAMELTVGAGLAITVGAAMTETVGASKAETIGASKTESVGSNHSVTIGKDANENVGAAKNLQVAKDLTEKVGGKHAETVEKELIVNAKKIQLVAKDEISIKTGSAQILMKKNGDVTIKGKKITIKGSGDVIIKGSQIKEN